MIGLLAPMIGAFVAMFARTTAWMFAAPLTGDAGVPPRFRVAIAALVAVALTPLHAPVAFEDIPLTVPGELVIGLGIGFVARVLLAGIEAAGQLVGLELELGFAGQYDPMLREEALPTRRIAATVGGLAWLSVGGLEQSVRVLSRAQVDGRTLGRMIASVTSSSSEVLVLAVRAAGPIMVAALVANLAVALASRAAPAMNIFSVALATVLIIGALTFDSTSAPFVHEIFLVVRRALDGTARLVTG